MANYTFTDGVRAALAAAREAANGLRHDYLGTEHLLLGLLQDARVRERLESLRIEPGEVEARLVASVRPGKATVRSGELPYTSRAKKTLELAMRETREAGDSWVDVEHLLIGVAAEERGIGAQVLAALGATLERLRAARASGSGAPVAEPESPFRVLIDDASSASIYEQIVQQVKEAVATGTLRSGDRLPAVRRLADQLDIAPGTVARAYGELESSGVVVTEGARGTRVAPRERGSLPHASRPETLAGLLRPIAVAAFHLGATESELREALERAMTGIFGAQGGQPAR